MAGLAQVYQALFDLVLVWLDLVLAQLNFDWPDLVLVQLDLDWPGLAWLGLAWFSSVWLDLARLGLIQFQHSLTWIDFDQFGLA